MHFHFSCYVILTMGGGNDWDKQHFVSLNHMVWLRNDPRLCSQTWHLGLRTDLPRSVPPWFSHAERAQVDGHERIHLSNSQSFTAIDSRCQWEGFELLCASPKEACSLFLERERGSLYTQALTRTHTFIFSFFQPASCRGTSRNFQVLGLCLSRRRTLQQMQ